MSTGSGKLAVKFIEKLGASFKYQFNLESYREFFKEMRCKNAEYTVVDGRMSCAITVIEEQTEQDHCG